MKGGLGGGVGRPVRSRWGWGWDWRRLRPWVLTGGDGETDAGQVGAVDAAGLKAALVGAHSSLGRLGVCSSNDAVQSRADCTFLQMPLCAAESSYVVTGTFLRLTTLQSSSGIQSGEVPN